jgi:hypothetical protein
VYAATEQQGGAGVPQIVPAYVTDLLTIVFRALR